MTAILWALPSLGALAVIGALILRGKLLQTDPQPPLMEEWGFSYNGDDYPERLREWQAKFPNVPWQGNSPPMDWTVIRATHRRRDPYEHDIRG